MWTMLCTMVSYLIYLLNTGKHVCSHISNIEAVYYVV